jgi:hypothetical protein
MQCAQLLNRHQRHVSLAGTEDTIHDIPYLKKLQNVPKNTTLISIDELIKTGAQYIF